MRYQKNGSLKIPTLLVVGLLLALTIGAFSLPAQSVRQTTKPAPPQPRKMNVLFISVDDLRPQIGAYGVADIRTPNMDALAKRGTTFMRAYCQQAVCSPSRTSLMTGRRPDTTKVYDLRTHFRTTIPDVVTLPQHFKQQRYHTQAFGKIYHGGLDDEASWSAPSFGSGTPNRNARNDNRRSPSQTSSPLQTNNADEDDLIIEEEASRYLKTSYAQERAPRQGGNRRRAGQQQQPDDAQLDESGEPIGRRGNLWEARDVPDNALGDGKSADEAIKTMRAVKDKPFFLAVGFRKPHLPFVAPKKYFDMYPLEKMRLASNPNAPKDVPAVALTRFGELRAYNGIPKAGALSDEKAREVIRGYYAATSFADAQIGRVINALDEMGLRDNTIIILWGDHGWQLGEHGLWAKHTNFETSTRSPLIVSVPKQKNVGAKTNALVEFVDIYPTLCELAGLPVPNGLEGTSFAPVLNDPQRRWKQAAFSQYPRPGRIMGYTMRTDRYRYTEWSAPNGRSAGVELYDHQTDPDENVNVADRPENKKLVAEMSRMLRAGWRANVPAGGATTGTKAK